MAIDKNKQKIIILIAVFAVIGAGIGAIIYLKLKSNSDIQAKITELESQIDAQRAKQEQRAQLETKKNEILSNIADLVKILPPLSEATRDAFLRTINKFVEETELECDALVTLSSPEARKDKKRELFRRHRYSLELRGPFVNFIRFLERIEIYKRFFKVDDFSIKNLKGGKGVWPEPEKDIELTISIYTYEPGKIKK